MQLKNQLDKFDTTIKHDLNKLKPISPVLQQILQLRIQLLSDEQEALRSEYTDLGIDNLAPSTFNKNTRLNKHYSDIYQCNSSKKTKKLQKLDLDLKI